MEDFAESWNTVIQAVRFMVVVAPNSIGPEPTMRLAGGAIELHFDE